MSCRTGETKPQPCLNKPSSEAPGAKAGCCPLADYDSEAPLSCMEYLTKAQDAEGFVQSMDKQFENFRQKIQKESTGRGCANVAKIFDKPPWKAPEVPPRKLIRPKGCRSKTSSEVSEEEEIPEDEPCGPCGVTPVKKKKSARKVSKSIRQLAGPGPLRKKLWQYFENKPVEKFSPSIAPFSGPRDDCLNRAICRPIDEYEKFGEACQYHDDFMENLTTCCGFECPKKDEACSKPPKIECACSKDSSAIAAASSGTRASSPVTSTMLAQDSFKSGCGGSKKGMSPTPCSARPSGYSESMDQSSYRGMDTGSMGGISDYNAMRGFQPRHALIAQPPPFIAGIVESKPPPPDPKSGSPLCTSGRETPTEALTDESYYNQLLARAKEICESGGQEQEEEEDPECEIETEEQLLDHPIFGPPPKKPERTLAETFRLYKEHLSVLRRRYFGAVCKYIDDVDDITPEIAAAMVITEEQGFMMKAAPARLYEYLYPDQSSQPVMKIGDISEYVPAPANNMVVPLVPPMFLNASEYPGLEDPAMLDSPRIIQIGPSPNLAEEPKITETKLPMDIVEVVTGTVDNGGGEDEEEEYFLEDDEEAGGPTDFDIKLEQALPPHFARIQLRGSQSPNWFPGYYVAMPNRMGVMVQNHMGDVLEKVWEEVQPESIKPAGGAVVLGEL